MTTSYNSSTNTITITLPESGSTWYLDCTSSQLYEESNSTNPIDKIEADFPNTSTATESVNIQLMQAGYTFASPAITWNSAEGALHEDVTYSLNGANTVLTLSITDLAFADDNESFCFSVTNSEGEPVSVDPGIAVIRR